MEYDPVKSTNSKKLRIIRILLVVLILIFLIAIFFLINRSKRNGVGEETISSEETSDTIAENSTKDFVIKTKNYIDYQKFLECSGYASAYVLRSLGVDVSGLQVYNNIPEKNDNGTVPIPNLVNYLLSEGYEVNVCNGTLDDLKEELKKGTPVITFVRTGPNEEYFHYLPIVGYGEDSIYAVDSLGYKVNTDNEYYNRTIKNEDFLNMWDTGIYKKNTYITIGLK